MLQKTIIDGTQKVIYVYLRLYSAASVKWR